jgi:hypothetical protein
MPKKKLSKIAHLKLPADAVRPAQIDQLVEVALRVRFRNVLADRA